MTLFVLSLYTTESVYGRLKPKNDGGFESPPPVSAPDLRQSSFQLAHEFYHAPPKSSMNSLTEQPKFLMRDIQSQNQSVLDGVTISHLEDHVVAPHDPYQEESSHLDKRFTFKLPAWLTHGWSYFWKRSRVPDLTNPDTVLSLAKLAASAYSYRSEFFWFDIVNNRYSVLEDFGWSDRGLRGYVFLDPTKKILVLAFKGTSTRWTSVSGLDTADHDKFQDNSFYTCCCGGKTLGVLGQSVCDCDRGQYRCSNQCLKETLESPIYKRYSYFHQAQVFIWKIYCYFFFMKRTRLKLTFVENL